MGGPGARLPGGSGGRPEALPGKRPMTEEHFLTTEEVLEYPQVNLRTIYRLIKAGKIPAVRVGRQWRFRKKDIDTWLAETRSGARTSGPGADRHRISLITGYSTEAGAIEAVNLGVCGYLTKPFHQPRVLAVAARALGEAPSPDA